MSQEKVDRYKKEKANRKQTVKREKILNKVRVCAVAVVAVVLLGWVGYSVHNSYVSSRPVKEVQINYDAVSEYAQELATTAE